MDLHSTKRFVVREMIRRHKISNSTKNSLIELNLIKKIPNIREYHYVGKKPTKQMAQMLIDKVSLYYKKNDFVKKIKEYKQSVTINENEILQLPSFKHVKIINETKEQPFLLWFKWVYNKKIMFLFKEKITNTNIMMVYATDYNNACEKLKLEYKDFEIIHIKDLAIR